MISSIAVCFQNLEEISGHAGSCQNYLIYKILDNKIVEKKVLQLAPEEALHNTFHNPNANPNHPLFKVDVLLTGGIGLGGINRLKMYQVKTYIVTETNPDLAVNDLLEDKLVTLGLDNEHPAGSCGCH